MVALRVHLDPCGPADGPLRVIPGSHLKGKMGDEELRAYAREPYEDLTAEVGDVIAMRPLLVHSSPKATAAGKRRRHAPRILRGVRLPILKRATFMSRTAASLRFEERQNSAISQNQYES